jgi:hypothetical protein
VGARGAERVGLVIVEKALLSRITASARKRGFLARISEYGYIVEGRVEIFNELAMYLACVGCFFGFWEGEVNAHICRGGYRL